MFRVRLKPRLPDTTDLMKALRDGWIGLLGAIAVYLGHWSGTVDAGEYTPFVTALAALVIAFLQRLIVEYAAPDPPSDPGLPQALPPPDPVPSRW